MSAPPPNRCAVQSRFYRILRHFVLYICMSDFSYIYVRQYFFKQMCNAFAVLRCSTAYRAVDLLVLKRADTVVPLNDETDVQPDPCSTAFCGILRCTSVEVKSNVSTANEVLPFRIKKEPAGLRSAPFEYVHAEDYSAATTSNWNAPLTFL